MKTVAVAMTALMLSMFSIPANAGERELKDAIELFYVKKGTMGTVACDTESQGGNAFVYCYPAREARAKATGGLYALRLSPPGIMPLNGKARTHTERLSSLEAMDGSPIPLVEAPQDLRVKVGEIRDLFR